MKTLAEKECSDCKTGTVALHEPKLSQLTAELGGEWHVAAGHHLEREFSFKNFRDALAFTNRVGELAEKLGHHPDIFLAWGKVRLTIWTHSIEGLTENDFILAAKVNKLA